ncbi:maleylacetoacetate isomerase [Parvibaculum sp.]|uniref:maleylacetoacetate isomerase n=1 Tax=Parvibaculum sp. TaxID=2024848 RepID=UPI00320D379A
MRLYNFFRNSAGYRVRAVLNLKGIPYEHVSIDIRPPVEAQFSEEFRKVNPLSLIPALEHDGRIITQSSAIIEYLEELFPEPSVFPKDAALRAQSRAFAASVAAETHALLSMRVMKFLDKDLGLPQADRDKWQAQWAHKGFAALEAMLKHGPDTQFAYADYPTVADIFLVPQYYNLRHAKMDLSAYPRLGEIVARCEALPAFQKASPEAQPDYDDR